MSYTKLFSSVLLSSVWAEDNATRLVWITLLASKDRDGIVEGSVPGLAHVARVSVDECRRALEILSSPDPESRTKTKEGRRIEKVPLGWYVINHDLYQGLQSAEDMREKARLRVERHRERKASVTPGNVTSRSVTPGNDRSRPVTSVTPSGSGSHSGSSLSPSHLPHTLGVVRTARPVAGRPDPECGGDGEENLRHDRRESPFGAVVAAANRQGDVE